MPNGRILFAPAGSGKTTFAKERSGFVDGDDIIAAQVGWPSGKWWKLPGADAITNERIDHLFRFAARHPEVVVLTGLRTDSFEPTRPGVDTRVYIPAEETIAGFDFKNRSVNQPNKSESISQLPDWRRWAEARDLVQQTSLVWE
jgi:shikimate kinase